MQFGVYIDQAAVARAGLAGSTDVTDWFLIEYLRGWWKHGRGRTVEEGGKTYWWANLQHTLDELPLLPFRTTSALSRRISQLRDLGILETTIRRRMLFLRPGPKLTEVDGHRGAALADRRTDPAPVENSGTGAKPEQAPDADCRESLRERNNSCASATGTVASAQPIRVPGNPKEERAAPRRPREVLHSPSQKRSEARPGAPPISPVEDAYRFAVQGIRSRVPDFVDLEPRDKTLGVIRTVLTKLGTARMPGAPLGDRLDTGRHEVRRILGFAFGADAEQVEPVRWLEQNGGWTVSRAFTGRFLTQVAQCAAGRAKRPTRDVYAERTAEYRREAAAAGPAVPPDPETKERIRRIIGRKRMAPSARAPAAAHAAPHPRGPTLIRTARSG